MSDMHTDETETSGVLCMLCPHGCRIAEGAAGFCRARVNRNGQIIARNYGIVTGLSLDPIEKKPLFRFHPGSVILSVGSFGCNFRCGFCQNHEISMAEGKTENARTISPAELAEMAKSLVPRGNIGLAFTYNEPLIGYEYLRDCAELNRAQGLVNVVVTNGYLNEQPLRALLPLIDAMNIDLKGFTEAFYKKISGSLDVIKRNIAVCAEDCHVELTTLIIPGENDTPDEMRALSHFVAGIDPSIPLHITRFFPRYRMADAKPTPIETVEQLCDIAQEELQYVYKGNC